MKKYLSHPLLISILALAPLAFATSSCSCSDDATSDQTDADTNPGGGGGSGGSGGTGGGDIPAGSGGGGVGGDADVAEDPDVETGGSGGDEKDEGVDEGPDEPPTTDCLKSVGANVTGTNEWTDGTAKATVEIAGRETCERTYTISTTAPLRNPSIHPNPRVVKEESGWPTLRSGHDILDAIYALTLLEVRENSVESIHDYGFKNGESVSCSAGGCFETGRIWNYVWTRDTAYAVDLGLAGMDPTRSQNSLEFKLSERRSGGGMQIVQDTGTGGSYPVSTDRVAWAVGAAELLHQMDGAKRVTFRGKALTALRNTIAHDRDVAFDSTDGLYRGEQSFLDWREQTYPEWTKSDVVHIGMSKSLSTNLLHYRAIQLASELSDEIGDTANRDLFAGMATNLANAIRNSFWLASEGMYSTYLTTTLDQSPVRRYDLLGSSMAVIFGVATTAQAESILSKYPHYGPGAPVVWPQQQETPIYHNRGEWPFVTAYWLRAAKIANNDAVANKMMHALIRGTAMNLSNMENFEARTGAPWLEDGDFSGPVVNSERQLWSVAALVSMVHHTLFGIEATAGGLKVRPYVPASFRKTVLAGSSQVVLNDLPYMGKRITVVLHLPTEAGTGALGVGSIKLNGDTVTGDFLPVTSLNDTNQIDVDLVAGTKPNSTIKTVSATDWKSVFGPKTPKINSVGAAATGIELKISGREADDVKFRVFRDGSVVADDLPGATSEWTWIDDSLNPDDWNSPCYSVEATFSTTGTHSQHSNPMCWWGASSVRVTEISANDFVNIGGVKVNEHGRYHLGSWGDDGHRITVEHTPTVTGKYLIQLEYGNGAGPISTGITCAVKYVGVEDMDGYVVVGGGFLMMPHLASWGVWSGSNFVTANLVAGKKYRITVMGSDEAVNMSSFAHFVDYTAGSGGAQVFNRVNVAQIKVLAVGP
ncbi:MAG: hypothetical protein FWD57_00345 [Polyangiaceae bacterium]|nr:hypothetical protein [Polyangiaceae bacterium]